MKYNGTLNIKGVDFVNPIMEIKGIFDSLDEDEIVLYKYLECYFTCDNLKGVHSRHWIVESEDVQTEISNNETLNKFS
jgi:hypothetical protein